jgi:putative transcriptional regulator
MGLSQTKFAQLIGVSVRTLHKWEQHTSSPSGAAKTLLKVAASNPQAVRHALRA